MFLFGLWGKNDFLIFKWLAKKIKREIVPDTWKLYEIQNSVSISEVLLEYSHARLFTCCLGPLSCSNSRVVSLQWRSFVVQSWKCLTMCILHLQLYWDIIDIKHCVSLRHATWWFDVGLYCKMMTIRIWRVKGTCIQPLTSHSYHFVCMWWECLRSALSAGFKNTKLVTVVAMLYIRFSEVIYLIAKSLYPLNNITPFPLLAALSNHHSTLCFYEFIFSFVGSTYKQDQTVLVFLSDLFHLA